MDALFCNQIMTEVTMRKRTSTPTANPPKRRRRSNTDTSEVRAIAEAMRDLEIVYRDIDEVHDYEFNPRNNKEAIDVVRQSIKQFGFLNPLIVDSDDIIVVGHTRRAAAKLEGFTRVPTITADHLTAEQIAAFRIVDNKVGEVATWNYELLAKEINGMDGIDMTDFGFKREQIDCLEGMVAEDCLDILEVERQEESSAAINAPANAKQAAPSQTRFVIGEFVLHVPAEAYQAWAREVREENEFSQDKINLDILRRLGVEYDDSETD